MNRTPSPTAGVRHCAQSRGGVRSDDRSSGALAFILGSVLLGTIGIFVREANASPITATWFRCAFGLLGITVWLMIRKEVAALRLTRSNRFWVLGAAVLMVLA